MPDPLPLRLLLLTFAGFVNRHQAAALAYLVEENRVLREQLGKKRQPLTDDQRRRLAANGHALGRKLLREVATIVTPDTILRWHRRMIAAKWTYATGTRVGRPGIMKAIRKIIVRMATDNTGWGYCRIQGELKKLDHRVARSTIAKTLQEHGIRPSSERPMSWRTFLRSHADVICAADFFTTEVWTARGLVTHYTLFVIELATRRVHIAGTTTNPNEAFMAQVGRNLTDAFDGFLRETRFLILDRDKEFTAQFRAILEAAGAEPLITSYQAPEMKAFAERWVRSIKTELLSRRIFIGAKSLDRALRDYLAHYHAQRPHQGLGNERFQVSSAGPPDAGSAIAVDELQGGLLKSYRRCAA